MSLTPTRVGNTSVRGDKEYNTIDFTAGGTYPSGGEQITAASVGAATPITEVQLPPVTAGGFYPIRPIYNSDGSVGLMFMELSAGAAGTPALQEKTNAEAYVASTAFRAVFVSAS